MKILSVLLLSLIFAGCDTLVFMGPDSQDSSLASDADFISFTGEKYEKYYRIVDPATHNRRLADIESETIQSNSFLLSDVTYRHFYNASLDTQIRGTLGYYGQRMTTLNVPGEGSGTMTIWVTTNPTSGGSMPFSNQVIPINLFEYAFNTTHEPISIEKPFSNSSLVLPLTSDYSSNYGEFLYRTFSFTLPADYITQLSEIIPIDNSRYRPDRFHPIDVNSTPFEIFERFVLSSRNFYQYRHFTARYASNIKVMGFAHFPIVESFSWDLSQNAVTVYFHEYDEPYIGPVISYWIQAEDGSLIEKTIRIDN